MHTCRTLSEDVHVVFWLSCHYLFHFFARFQFSFFSYGTVMLVACGRNSSYSFIPNFLKLCRYFCHGLKMCMCLWGYPLIIFINFFHFFDVVFQVYLVLEYRFLLTLWAQFILQFSILHFSTMHTCSTWSEGVRMVLGSPSHYFYLFLHF